MEALSMLNHPTATAVFEYIHSTNPSVSRATVFRVLKQAEENGSIARLSFAGGEDRFDYNAHPHYHVRCSRCGIVCDVEMPYLNHLEKKVTNAYGFSLQTHDVEFKGVCPDCQGTPAVKA